MWIESAAVDRQMGRLMSDRNMATVSGSRAGRTDAGHDGVSCMIEVEWWEYDDADEMAEAVAGDIGFIIESALDARGQALIALPGGKSPALIFEKLAAAKIKWKHVTIIPTDDRLVAVDSPLSNVATIARHFLPKGARVLPIATEAAADYRAAGKAADARLADLQWPPDLMWLGVGADGHTASIFPGPDLEEEIGIAHV